MKVLESYKKFNLIGFGTTLLSLKLDIFLFNYHDGVKLKTLKTIEKIFVKKNKIVNCLGSVKTTEDVDFRRYSSTDLHLHRRRIVRKR